MTRPRQATPEEVAALWPAVDQARLFARPADYTRFACEAQWRVRVASEGADTMMSTAALLDRWRDHLDVLSIMYVWAPVRRIPAFVADAVSVAYTLGLSRVISPLMPAGNLDGYREAGMHVLEEVAAYRGNPGGVPSADVPSGVTIRPAAGADVPAIVDVDKASFFDFWRFGVPEVQQSLRDGWVKIAEDEEGILGYSALLLNRDIATLSRLAVAPRGRRRGLGMALLSDAAALAKTMGARDLTICTQMSNHEARMLYRRGKLLEVPERYVLAVTNLRHTR